MRLHFIAIGGSVMHQLAISLHKKGYEITGSDDEIFEPAAGNLKKEGLLPAKVGWFPETIGENIDAIILGMHARQDNPELEKALSLGIKVYSFPEYIYQESRTKKRVAVGGSHGKTTVTSMIMHVLKRAGLDFDFLVGARLEGFENSVKISDADIIVCEADEYPASTLEKRPKFHFLRPHIAVLTGIAWDHINVFPTFENYLHQFKIFIETIESDGCLIYNQTDNVLRELVLANRRDDIEYVPYQLPSYFIENNVTSVMAGGNKVPLKIFGNHNLLNLEATRLVSEKLGVSVAGFANAISTFSGAAKRLELLGANEHLKIYRDFAHAPSKVAASVSALKQQFPEHKLFAILELHTFSSLSENFLSEYRGALDVADEAVVYYSDHALTLKRLPPLDEETIRREFGSSSLLVLNKRLMLEAELKKFSKEKAVYLFMSSGNFDGLEILSSFPL